MNLNLSLNNCHMTLNNCTCVMLLLLLLWLTSVDTGSSPTVFSDKYVIYQYHWVFIIMYFCSWQSCLQELLLFLNKLFYVGFALGWHQPNKWINRWILFTEINNKGEQSHGPVCAAHSEQPTYEVLRVGLSVKVWQIDPLNESWVDQHWSVPPPWVV